MKKEILEKRAILEAMEYIITYAEESRDRLRMKYQETEEVEPVEKYNKETGKYETVYNENGTIKYRNVWKELPIKEEDMDEETKFAIKAYDTIIKKIETLI